MIRHYFIVAVRQLLKYRTQNLISIMGLSVCLLCFSICLYISRYILSTDQCFPNRERIAEITLTGKNEFSGTPSELCTSLRNMSWANVEAFTYVAYCDERSYDIEVKSNELLPFAPVMCLETDSCFQEVFSLSVLAGSWQAASHTPNAIVMSESLARRIYGDNLAEAIGKRLMTNEKLRYYRKSGGIRLYHTGRRGRYPG